MHDISSGFTAEDIDRRLWLELTPEQYELVRELIRLEADAPIVGLLDETERVVAGLEAHLPGLAPAIRIIANHLIEAGAIYEEGAPARACCVPSNDVSSCRSDERKTDPPRRPESST